MKLSYKWLCEFTNLESIPFDKIIEKINLSICEVDHIEEYKKNLETVICVKILSSEKLNNANLTKYIASDGSNEYQIISGDPSLTIDDKIPLALPGTILGDKKIETSIIKNEKSHGMFCSEKDLGISEENSGVMKLDETIIVGLSLRTLYDYEDKILTIDNKSITHRPDLWCHFGFARELASQLSLKITFNPLEKGKWDVDGSIKEKINIEKSEFYHSYKGIIIKNVNVKKSILKIKNKLEKCGLKSINNIVDISNYVLLEIGQPTHFFDKNILNDINISVKKGSSADTLTILDSNNIVCQDILMIANNGKPVAIAGVMGGLESSVTDSTTDLFLESAVFKREDIRKSIRTTGIRSEASIRYEKGLNPSLTSVVIHRIISLLKENGSSELKHSDIFGLDGNYISNNIIHTNYDFIKTKLGKEINNLEIDTILEKLGFKVESKSDSIKVTVPEYRSQYDVTIKEDLVEEVGRTVGYGNIELTPVNASILPAKLNNSRTLERELKKIFSYHLNYNEIYSYSFISKEQILFEDDSISPLEIKNAMPKEYQYLRTSLYPGLIQNIIKNKDRFENIKIYELGRNYFKEKEGLGKEIKNLTLMEYDNDSNEIIENRLFEIREKIVYCLSKLNITELIIEKIEKKYFQPSSGILIKKDSLVLAELGLLHPKIQLENGIKKKLFMGSMYLESILKKYIQMKNIYTFKAPSNYPQDKLDISLVMNESQNTEVYSNLVLKENIDEIENIYVTSIYRGESIPKDFKSVTYHFELINYKETFTQTKIKLITDKLLFIAKENGFQVR
jgi:phenylalanyl-tRNA synthetase beta chain